MLLIEASVLGWRLPSVPLLPCSASSNINVVGDRSAEPHQLAFKEDGREDEDVGQMLTAVEGVDVDIEVTLDQGVNGVVLGTRPKGCRQGAKMLNHQMARVFLLNLLGQADLSANQ